MEHSTSHCFVPVSFLPYCCDSWYMCRSSYCKNVHMPRATHTPLHRFHPPHSLGKRRRLECPNSSSVPFELCALFGHFLLLRILLIPSRRFRSDCKNRQSFHRLLELRQLGPFGIGKEPGTHWLGCSKFKKKVILNLFME